MKIVLNNSDNKKPLTQRERIEIIKQLSEQCKEHFKDRFPTITSAEINSKSHIFYSGIKNKEINIKCFKIPQATIKQNKNEFQINKIDVWITSNNDSAVKIVLQTKTSNIPNCIWLLEQNVSDELKSMITDIESAYNYHNHIPNKPMAKKCITVPKIDEIFIKEIEIEI